jgi:hypothetical protein
MNKNRRSSQDHDRRSHPRGGRRERDVKKPWYLRRRLWLATATLLYVGWRRMRTIANREARNSTSGLAA